jgi:hypothetical protein
MITVLMVNEAETPAPATQKNQTAAEDIYWSMVDYLRDGLFDLVTPSIHALMHGQGLVHERLRRRKRDVLLRKLLDSGGVITNVISLTCLHAWSKRQANLSILRPESRATALTQRTLQLGSAGREAKPDFQSYAMSALARPARTIPEKVFARVLETMLTSVRSGEISSTRNAAPFSAVLTAAAS